MARTRPVWAARLAGADHRGLPPAAGAERTAPVAAIVLELGDAPYGGGAVPDPRAALGADHRSVDYGLMFDKRVCGVLTGQRASDNASLR